VERLPGALHLGVHGLPVDGCELLHDRPPASSRE